MTNQEKNFYLVPDIDAKRFSRTIRISDEGRAGTKFEFTEQDRNGNTLVFVQATLTPREVTALRFFLAGDSDGRIVVGPLRFHIISEAVVSIMHVESPSGSIGAGLYTVTDVLRGIAESLAESIVNGAPVQSLR